MTSLAGRIRTLLFPALLTAGIVTLLLCFPLAGTAAAKDRIWESEKDNVLLNIPNDMWSTWEWLKAKPDWKKRGIVKAAARRIVKLKNGDPADGEGGLLYLAIRDVEEGESLADLVAGKSVQDFFLKRFGSKRPKVETEASTVLSGTDDEGHPSLILRAEGQAPNLKAKAGKCQCVLVATKLGTKLYLLAAYGFPSEHGLDGISNDLDILESNGLELLSTKAKPGGPRPGPKPGEDENGGGPGEDEEREAELIENVDQKWRLTIHKNLERGELTREEKDSDLVLKIVHNETEGGVVLYLYAPLTTSYVDGVKRAPFNIMKWMTSDWWVDFDTNHPKGAISTWKWPRKPEGKNPTFLVVPDMSDEKNHVTVFKPKQLRPKKVSQGEATKKLKFVEKPKKNNIGKKGKGGEALRGCLEGNREGGGMETVLRYAWRSPSHSYRLFVIFSRKGYLKFGDPIRKTLESFEFVKKM